MPSHAVGAKQVLGEAWRISIGVRGMRSLARALPAAAEIALVCPAALPVRADFGALGLWSLLCAAIGPVAFLAGLAGIGSAAAKAGIVGLGRRRRVVLLHFAWFELTPRRHLPIAQPC
jgi:hypothetical protein